MANTASAPPDLIADLKQQPRAQQAVVQSQQATALRLKAKDNRKDRTLPEASSILAQSVKLETLYEKDLDNEDDLLRSRLLDYYNEAVSKVA